MVLIAFKTEVLDGSVVLQKALKLCQPYIDVVAISSLLKESGPNPKSNSKLTVAIKGEVELDQKDFMAKIRQMEEFIEQHFPQRYFAAWLLAYNENIMLLPNLVLPHPRLAMDKIILRAASEIWGSYTHPILNKPLHQISESELGGGVTFVAQGKTILT